MGSLSLANRDLGPIDPGPVPALPAWLARLLGRKGWL